MFEKNYGVKKEGNMWIVYEHYKILWVRKEKEIHTTKNYNKACDLMNHMQVSQYYK